MIPAVPAWRSRTRAGIGARVEIRISTRTARPRRWTVPLHPGGGAVAQPPAIPEFYSPAAYVNDMCWPMHLGSQQASGRAPDSEPVFAFHDPVDLDDGQ